MLLVFAWKIIHLRPPKPTHSPISTNIVYPIAVLFRCERLQQVGKLGLLGLAFDRAPLFFRMKDIRPAVKLFLKAANADLPTHTCLGHQSFALIWRHCQQMAGVGQLLVVMLWGPER